MSPEIDALLFDVFGTLVDWRGSIARELRATLAPLGLECDWAAMATDWRHRYQPAMERIRSSGRTFVKLDILHRENLLETLEAFTVEGLDGATIDRLNLAWHRLDPWPDVLPAMARLRPKFLLAPCSNGNVRLMVDLARHAGFPWDAILGAEPARAYKPMPAAYLHSAALLDLRPERCLMVAAHNGDLAAARACGLRTAFFPRPNEHAQPLDLEPSAVWDLVAADLLGLADMLGC